MRTLIQDNFKKLVDLTKTPQKHFTVLDDLVSIIISHYFDNKHISKRAEAVYDEVLIQSKSIQNYLGIINKSLQKIYDYDSAQNGSAYLPVLLKLYTKLVKVMNKQTLSFYSEEIFKQIISGNMNHSNAEVRKNVIFCLVEMRFVMGE